MTGPNPVYLALDTADLQRALALAKAVRAHVGGLKIGLEFITANGPEGVRAIVKYGLPVFADVKFHDIPNTVAAAVRAIAQLGVAMLNVHTAGGAAMLRASVEAAGTASPRPRVLGVTVLTSLLAADLVATGIEHALRQQVVKLAKLAQDCGLDGIVCSPQEIAEVRAACGPRFLIVAPGIRPPCAEPGDQRRTLGPAEALRAGADILVVGRPITEAPDPAAAARALIEELRGTRSAARA